MKFDLVLKLGQELPRISGIYFIFESLENPEFLYIGHSMNIRNRFNNHYIINFLDSAQQYYMGIIRIYDDAKRKELEKLFIQHYNPIYNIHYRNITTFKIYRRVPTNLDDIYLDIKELQCLLYKYNLSVLKSQMLSKSKTYNLTINQDMLV